VSRSQGRLLSFTGFALVVALLLSMLHVIAARITAGHLLNEADQQLGLLESGQPLWQWRLARPSDLIAGRAFGHARVSQISGGLKVTSLDGSPFELGLPIASGLDLAHWPLLDVQLDSRAAGVVDILWQGNTADACIATAAHALPASGLRINLSTLDWTAAGGVCRLSNSAQMLRLRITIPAGADVELRAAALLATDKIPLPVDPAAAIALPQDATPAWIAAASSELSAAPLFHLAGTSAESLLSQRDQIRQYRPGALIVPAGSVLTAATRLERPSWVAWAASPAYLLLLFALARWQPAGKWGAWLEIAASIGGPLWLIAGLQWGLHPSVPGLAAFAGALVFAAVSEWRRHDRNWHWLGPWSTWTWWRPLGLVPVAVLVCLIWGHAFQPILARHALIYLGWALLQQWLILAVIMGRLERLLPGSWTALVVAAFLFALLHTPNGMLMAWCLLAEICWAWCFRRSRSLLPVALAHAICALLVESGLVGPALRSLEVGARFFS
jgi:membrane protease YdiL (CAAX protease family)